MASSHLLKDGWSMVIFFLSFLSSRGHGFVLFFVTRFLPDVVSLSVQTAMYLLYVYATYGTGNKEK